MGTSLNMEIWARVHVDDYACQKKILKAHKAIFKLGASINSVHMKNLLQDESLVPTIASTHHLWLSNINEPTLEQLLWVPFASTTDVQLLPHVCGWSTTQIWTQCMESNLHTSDVYPACCGWDIATRTELSVCKWVPSLKWVLTNSQLDIAESQCLGKE